MLPVIITKALVPLALAGLLLVGNVSEGLKEKDILMHEEHEIEEMFEPLKKTNKDLGDYMYMYHDKKGNYYYKNIITRQYIIVKK